MVLAAGHLFSHPFSLSVFDKDAEGVKLLLWCY